MSMIPKVSIVLPCFNGAKMLGEAIDSVITQTFKDWELIIVNDCSTDNTLDIASSYAEQDPRIKVFSNERNMKLPATLNHGFREANGEYWTWTSDDNLLLPNMLEEMVSFLDKHPQVGLVVADREIIDVSGNVLNTVIVQDNLQDLLPLFNVVQSAFLYRKEIALAIGEYREDLFLVEDYEYWLRMSEFTVFAHLPRVLYKERKHPNSLTSTRQKEIAERLTELRLSYLNKTEQYFKDNKKRLSSYYCRIVDSLKGRRKIMYYLRFANNLPFSFGLRYILIHLPHKWLKTIRRRFTNN